MSALRVAGPVCAFVPEPSMANPIADCLPLPCLPCLQTQRDAQNKTHRMINSEFSCFSLSLGTHAYALTHMLQCVLCMSNNSLRTMPDQVISAQGNLGAEVRLTSALRIAWASDHCRSSRLLCSHARAFCRIEIGRVHCACCSSKP
jgi:hypothetical protein